jgi:hypothetical protein
MPVPTHREDCQTTLWRTRCPDCGDIVYFFSCTCGSKVFFDLNRPPWNPHEDRCIPYLIRYLRDVQGFSSTHIRRLIEEYATLHNISIPPEIHRQIIAQENRDTGKIVIIEVLPYENRCFVVGQLISVNLRVNFFKRLNYRDNAIGRALLGRLVKESYVEIVLRQDPDEETRICDQFTFFLPVTVYEQSRLRQGSRAIANLSPYSLPDGQQVWIADEIHRAQ